MSVFRFPNHYREIAVLLAATACQSYSPLSRAELSWPPTLPGGVMADTGTSESLLRSTTSLKEGIQIAREAPTVDFLYFDCQTYEASGGVWSNWGDSFVSGDHYYCAVGDHMSPGGNAFVYEYDSKGKTLRQLTDLRSILNQPDGRYTPGKIHSEIGLGKDGWLYFSTHRGSTKIAFHPTAGFSGDWILRLHPATGKGEIIAHSPLPMQCLPAGILDPDRLIFYAGTADGRNEKEPQFLAYDIQNRKVIASRDQGPARGMILSRRSGRVYFHPEKEGAARLVRFDPNAPDEFVEINAVLGLRCATRESPEGLVYTVDSGQLWRFDTTTESAKALGPVAVGEKDYIASIDLCPVTGRYLYYVPGAHGGAQIDGSPLVQYDLKTGSRKVICFLADYCFDRFGYIPMGSYCSSLSEDGTTVFITWMGNRGTSPESRVDPKKVRFNTCALTVIHLPESERKAD